MSTFVVLGMHRSGTTLVSKLLETLGVDMGVQNYADADSLWEDIEMAKFNDQLLTEAGGSWSEPPLVSELAAAGHRMKPAIEATLMRKQRPGRWGWKDPRTALTIPLLHPYLKDPRYIHIRRDKPDIVASLIERNGAGSWESLAEIYAQRIETFLEGTDAPMFTVRYEDLTHPKAAFLRLRQLAEFAGCDDQDAIATALGLIQYRDRWGFGRIGIGVPYYKACYEFFRWWSWVLVGGLEVGDKLLNTPGLRCEVPIPMAHNGLVKEFLKADADTLVIAEDDHAAQQDTIRCIREKEENQRFDIVCASYVNRRTPIDAIVGCNFTGNINAYGEVDVLLEPMKVAESGTQQYDCAALGLVFIRRWVLESMMGDAGPDDYFWFDWCGRNSQDIQFYWKAKQVGARVGVDRDNPVAHIGKQVYTMEQFYRARRRLLTQVARAEQQKMEAKHG